MSKKYRQDTFTSKEDISEMSGTWKMFLWNRNGWDIGDPSPCRFIFPTTQETIENALRKHYGAVHLYPVYKYEHGLVRLEFSKGCSWDSCLIGYLALPEKDALMAQGRKRSSKKWRENELPKLLEERFGILKLWSAWFSNDLYEVWDTDDPDYVDAGLTRSSLEKYYPDVEEMKHCPVCEKQVICSHMPQEKAV